MLTTTTTTSEMLLGNFMQLLLFVWIIVVDGIGTSQQSSSVSDQQQFALCPDVSASLEDALSSPSPSSPSAIVRSLAFLPRAGASAHVQLHAADGLPEGAMQCALRLESCAECMLRMQWESPVGHFTDLQIQSFRECASDARTERLRSPDDAPRACFSLDLVEERADRVLQDAPSTRAFFDVDASELVYRRVSLWDNNNGSTGQLNSFNSTGNTLWLLTSLRNLHADSQLARYLTRALFPSLRVMAMDGSEVIRIQQSPSSTNGNSEDAGGSSGDADASVATAKAAGFLQSPRFPAAYPRELRRNWTLLVAGQQPSQQKHQQRIWLAFDDFHLHYLSELRVLDSDGRTELYNSRNERDRNRRPTQLVSRGSALTVLFAANEFTEPIGFRVRYGLVAEQLAQGPATRSCDELLDNAGGRITLDSPGQHSHRHLLHEWVDCVWLIGALTAPGREDAVGELYLRVAEFHLRGAGVHLELREGGNSAGRLLLALDGEQTAKQLVQKQPEQGFTTQGDPPAFYMRLQGRLDTLTGLSVLYASFYRWPTATCTGGPDAEFHCDNGRCIRATLRCDGYDHCGDSSDELACQGSEEASSPLVPNNALLTVAFGILSAFLLVLLLVLLASRSARRHLVAAHHHSRRPLHQSQQHQRHHRRAATVQACCGGVAHQQQQQQQSLQVPNGSAQRRNSSALATQLDFAMLNNLMGSAAGANLQATPCLQSLGERRFFVVPATGAASATTNGAHGHHHQTPAISVIEAPPSYADALKHPKVSARGSRHLVHPAPLSPRLRLSPVDLLRADIVDDEGPSRPSDQDQQVDQLDSPGLLSRSTSPFQSPRSVIMLDDHEEDEEADNEKSSSSSNEEESMRRQRSRQSVMMGRDAEEGLTHGRRDADAMMSSSAPNSSRWQRSRQSPLGRDAEGITQARDAEGLTQVRDADAVTSSSTPNSPWRQRSRQSGMEEELTQVRDAEGSSSAPNSSRRQRSRRRRRSTVADCGSPGTEEDPRIV